jgi:hypothetical protein
MARTTIAPQETTLAGLNATMTAAPATGANNGVQFTNDGDTILVVTNGGGSPSVLTLDATGSLAGVALTDTTPSVPAGGTRYFGPFDMQAFGGTVGVDFSVITTVTCAAIRVPRP